MKRITASAAILGFVLASICLPAAAGNKIFMSNAADGTVDSLTVPDSICFRNGNMYIYRGGVGTYYDTDNIGRMSLSPFSDTEGKYLPQSVLDSLGFKITPSAPESYTPRRTCRDRYDGRELRGLCGDSVWSSKIQIAYNATLATVTGA